MTALTDEVRLIQNPALGAGLLWQFCLGYKEVSTNNPTLLHTFLVLPIILNDYSLALLESTRLDSGLSSVANKLVTPPTRLRTERIGGLEFTSGAENLFALHERVKMYRDLTFKSLVLGIDATLYKVDARKAHVIPVERAEPNRLLHSTKKMLETANKFGAMCGSHTLSEACKLLQVRF